MAEPRPEAGRGVDILERLFVLPSEELESALTHACNVLAEALRADKVDAFIHDSTRDSLVAVGSSTQPLSDLQRRLGLDVLPVSNGGRVVHVFQTGKTFVSGHLEQDMEELRGIRESLKIRSKLGVPLEVGGQRKGMVMIASLSPDFFNDDDVRLAELVVRWVGMAAHRAQLVEELTLNAAERARRAAAEELLTVVAHDLRNLIAPISARLDLLRARAERERREADARDADSGLKAARRLSQLVANILDTARIEQGLFTLEPHPLDLASLAVDVGRTLSTPLHQVEVAAPGEVLIEGDADRLRQVLENIVANAIQHSPRNVAVTVNVFTRQRNDSLWAFLEVRDQGPGIPEDILPRLFDRFAAGHRSEGLGLGLYIARRIAVAHGGDLSVVSSPGKGARFCLQLPCRAGEA
jgi:two-component system OmpR family sensor kinase